MDKPIIFAVDDEVQVCNAIERDLRQKYFQTYRIMTATSGEEALDTIKRLSHKGEVIALLLVDQHMPDMTGIELLKKVTKIYPEAKKILLKSHADTNAVIEAMNAVGLDHYIMKPWEPPEDNLYPALDDLLDDWAASATMQYKMIRVVGTMWSANSHKVKDFLSRCQIPYKWLDIEHDSVAILLTQSMLLGDFRLPIVIFPDGKRLIDPDLTTLANKLGLQTTPEKPYYDLIIVGAGPAGLAAAVYSASEGFSTLLIDKETTGGQAGTSSRIENYLGFPNGISGLDLARRATAQAARLGAEILTTQEVTEIRVHTPPYKVVKLADGTELTCKALILATGVSIKRLNVAGEQELLGAGVYYGAAVTEAEHYKGGHMVVVGGADSAGQGAIFFSRYARKVTMVVRGSSLFKGMSLYLINQIKAEPNIEVRLRSSVTELRGNNKLEQLVIRDNNTKETEVVDTDAVFIFIGAVPHTDMVADIVERNRAGFILTGTDLTKNNRRPPNWHLKRNPYLLETSTPGIFAVGDVRQGAVRRVAAAVGQGSTAISFVHQYLKEV